MIKVLLVGFILLGAFASPTNAASLIPAAKSDISADEHAIRDARKAYNSGLASRDAAAIAKYWQRDNSESIWVNGVLTIGRDNIVARYAKAFATRDFIWGGRTPDRVDVATEGRTYAAEVGTWQWRMRDTTWRCGTEWMTHGASSPISMSRRHAQVAVLVRRKGVGGNSVPSGLPTGLTR